MRVAYIAAGAAGMYCGSCIHDNTLARALRRQGVDLVLIPTYTPLRTDEQDVSIDRVFYSGISVFLEQKLALMRRMPAAAEWLFRRPALLNAVSRWSAATRAEDLGALTVSVLRGEDGYQHRELERLAAWLRQQLRPDLVQLTNSLFAGLARRLKEELGVPVLCALQGEDIFLDALVEPYRSQAREVLRERARDVDGFIAPCRYYADFMAEYLDVDVNSIDVVPLGLDLDGHDQGNATAPPPFTIGFLARVCPEKGLHILADAFARLAESRGADSVRLEAAGWLGANHRDYYRDVSAGLERRGLGDRFVYHGELDRAAKIRFLQRLHVLSVPAPYREPKGLYLLEALANGVPLVQPRHGGYPEMIAATGGGLLVDAPEAEAVAAGIEQLMDDDGLRRQLGRDGRAAVGAKFNDDIMAANTFAVYQRHIDGDHRKET